MAYLTRIKSTSSIQCFKFLKIPFHNNNAKILQGIHSTPANHVIELKMPSLSPTMESGTILNWSKKEGDSVSPGDVLCEIQTDKAVMAFETEEEGILAKIIVGDNSSDVHVGSLIALIAESGENWKSVQSSKNHNNIVKEGASTETPIVPKSSLPQTGNTFRLLGPAVRNLLMKYGLSSTNISATGPRGVLMKGDILNYVVKNELQPVQPIKENHPTPKAVNPTTKHVKPVKSSENEQQEYKDFEVSNMRRTIASRLTASKTGIPHAYNTISSKIDAIVNLRKVLKNEGQNVSINDIIIKAAAIALQKCPDVHVIWKGEKLINPTTVDVSVAVATSSGLITPIITDVVSRGFQDIGVLVRDLAERARKGKLQLHEFQGGSFTISNLGMYGIDEFSAIINPPQCAILAVGGSRIEIGDDGKHFTAMTTTLSYDEEAISPLAAATFMSTLRSLLESPGCMLIGNRT